MYSKKSEIAIIGSSNSGKSSLLNFVFNKKKLSFVSKKPGRTKKFNFFFYGDKKYLVDLPGYGYSKTSKIINAKFNKIIYEYIGSRSQLIGTVIVMDIRFPLKKSDINIIEFTLCNKRKVHLILNKSDKLNKDFSIFALNKTRLFLKKHNLNLSTQIMSTKHKIGKEQFLSILKNW